MTASALAPRLPELRDAGVRVWLVGNGAPEHIADFLSRSGLELRDVEVRTDPTLRVQRALGLARSFRGTYGPEALWAAARALGRGLRNGRPLGDPLQQGGALVVGHDGIVALSHRDRHLGDHVDPVRVVDVALGLLAAHAGVGV